jgi:phospholipid/cholesterol/gamma-HCH transport system substrate-binding protein
MKKNTGDKIRLGMFVTIGAALFIMGIFFIGQKQRLFSSTIQIKFLCKDVSGLQPGNNVRFSGINVGTVDNIEIVTDSTVQVDLLIDKSVKDFIKKDAQASIGSEGLMGDKVVNISTGSPGQASIENNDIVAYAGGSSMEEIMAQVKIVATNTAQITGDLSGIIGGIRQGKGTIGKLFVDTTFADNLDQTLVNVKNGAGGFSDNMDAVKNNFLFKGYFKKKEKEKQKAREKIEEEKK